MWLTTTSLSYSFLFLKLPGVFCTFWLENVLLATAACNFSTSELQKVVRARQFFNILTWKCASRYSGVQFFHIATSKSGPSPSVFLHFDLNMCFSLQRRAIFPHRNFKKWSEPVSFLTFWLEHVLLATAACNFSTSELQTVVRARQFFNILTWKCASRYSGVQFFHIATSKSGPPMRCFVHFDLKMCFSLQRRVIFQHRNFKKWSEHVARGTFWLKMCFSLHQRALFHVFSQQPPPHPPLYRGYFSTQPTHKSLKNTTFRDFPNISRNCSFFLLTLLLFSAFFIFWLCYSTLLFQLSILSEVRLLNFLR